ncbi:MAG: immunoglobulin domain-containing protein [Verrucomicrobiales bacterium]|nr:immunoglobulin domain-containing protein [Verrucomicrobiales bacterium]
MTLLCRSADSSDLWTWRNPLPTANGLYGVAYGNGQFVAVGDYSTILTSVDGVSWVRRRSASQTSLNGIVYGAGQFVAVGGGGNILTSEDGVNWVVRQSGTQDNLRGIAYGNGQFIAVGLGGTVSLGYHGTILTSEDGVNWVVRQSGTRDWLSAIAYGSGQFVAVGEGGALVTSADGVSWVVRQSGTRDWLSAIAYGSGQFVAVGGGGTLLTSTDGVTWVQRQLGTPDTLRGIVYGNAQFIAVGLGRMQGLGDKGTILSSADGVNWAMRQSGTRSWLHAIAYGGGQFVAVGGSAILTSTDGVTWVQRQTGPRDPLYGIAYGNGQFVAVGDNGTIVTSADGVTWIQRALGTQDRLYDIAYGNGQFVALGDNPRSLDTTIVTSVDGVTWVQRHAVTRDRLHDIAYGNGQFITVGDNGTIVISSDGATWLQRQAGTENSLYGIAYGNGQFVAVGDNGTVAISSNGVTWLQRQAGTENSLYGIAYGNGQFVAVGNEEGFGQDDFITSWPITTTSGDGVTWVQRRSRARQDLIDITYGNGQFIAVGRELSEDEWWTIIVTSADGVNWIPYSLSPTQQSLWRIAYGNGQFVAVGESGMILQLDLLMSTTSLPLIANQPRGQGVTSGDTATLNVFAFGATPLTYQWLFNGQAIPGATTSSLILDRALTNNSETYSVRVSNRFGSTTSSGVPVVVFASHDTSRDALYTYFPMGNGDLKEYDGVVGPLTVSFSQTTYQGQETFGYYQSVNRASTYLAYSEAKLLLLGGTSPSADLKLIPAAVFLDNDLLLGGGSRTSTGKATLDTPSGDSTIGFTATVTVSKTNVTIASRTFQDCRHVTLRIVGNISDIGTRQFLGQTMILAPSIGIIRIAAYDPDLNFLGWEDYTIGRTVPRMLTMQASGATNVPVAVISPDLSQNGGGGVAPISFHYLVGSSVTLAVPQAFGGVVFKRWAGADYQAGTNALVNMNWDRTVTAEYTPLMVVPPAEAPIITTQPQSQAAAVGGSVVFSVVVSGTPPLIFQWKRNGVDLPSRTETTLSLQNISLPDAGDYTVTVKNAAGVTASSIAKLTVLPASDGLRLSIGRNSEGTVDVIAATQVGRPYTLEGSSDLKDWFPVRQLSDGAASFTLSVSTGRTPHRFFRLKAD